MPSGPSPTRYLSPTVGGDAADRLEAEERERLAALDAEAAALEAARIQAPAVVFVAGGEVRLGAGGPVPPGGYRRSGDEAFVDRGAPPLIVAEAERLTDPDRTLAQGTVIQAALQTAVNSDLPGNVVAVVSGTGSRRFPGTGFWSREARGSSASTAPAPRSTRKRILPDPLGPAS